VTDPQDHDVVTVDGKYDAMCWLSANTEEQVADFLLDESCSGAREQRSGDRISEEIASWMPTYHRFA